MDNAKFVPTASWNDWGVNILTAQFSDSHGNTYPLIEYGANAIFDPAVDYLYVTQYEFDEFFIGSLQSAYNGDIKKGDDYWLVCTNEQCFFNTTCD